MATYTLQCPECGRLFIGHRRNAKYCSDACRKAHFNRVHGRSYKAYVFGPDGVVEAEHAPVDADEIARAVVDLRAAVGVLAAAELTGPVDLRASCGRLKLGLLEALEREGL